MGPRGRSCVRVTSSNRISFATSSVGSRAGVEAYDIEIVLTFFRSESSRRRLLLRPSFRPGNNLVAGESEMNIRSSWLKILTISLIVFSAAFPAAGQKTSAPGPMGSGQSDTSNRPPQTIYFENGPGLHKR